MPLSRRRRTTVRPVGPYPTTIARRRRSVDRAGRSADAKRSASGGFTRLASRRTRGHPPLEPRNEPVQNRIEHNRHDRYRDERVRRFTRQDAELSADAREDEGELADLRECDSDGQRDFERIAEHAHDDERNERLPQHHDRQCGQDEARGLEEIDRAATACPPRRRTAPRKRRASAVPRMRHAGCSRIGRRQDRPETRRAPSTHRRWQPSRRRCPGQASARSA